VALTYMKPINVIFQYISNKMQLYTVYLYLETALHVSGVISTHHQVRKQLYLQHLVFVTPFTATCHYTSIVNIFQYISKKMQRYTVYLYLETALHVSGGAITHHQKRKQLYLQHLLFVTPFTATCHYTCIVNIFQYISNKMQHYTVYLYLETALHVSGGTSTHHKEHIQLYLQHLVFVRPLLLSAAIAADSSNGLTNTRCCRYSCLRS
jgi:hypothetical protein